MDINTFVQVISKLPPQIAVLAKGPTGIGKSHIVHQIGDRLDMEVIDRRLSQMTEGDIIGLPELVDGVTRFAPIDWFVRACNEPVILFFDELNRATIEVQQRIDPLMMSFIEKYPARLRHTGQIEPGKVYPNPASWDRLNTSLSYANMSPTSCCGANYDILFYSLCSGFLGTETTISFVDYVKNYEFKFCAEDILNDYENKSAGIDMLSTDKKNDLLNLIVTFSINNEVTVTQAQHACNFVNKCSDEMLVNFMNMIMETKKLPNIRKFHKIIGNKIVEVVNAANDVK